MHCALFSAVGTVLLLLLNCGGGRGTSKCATKLTYVTNQFTSGEHAIRHASEYRLGLSVGSHNFVVSAILDTASSHLVINEKNFDFGTHTTTGVKPFIYQSGNSQVTAINAKDNVDVGCIVDKPARFVLTAKDDSLDNVLGLSFGDLRHNPHEKNNRPFLDQLVHEEGIYDIFSLALCRNFGSSRLLLGGIDDAMRPLIGNHIPIIERTGYVVPAIAMRLLDSKKFLGDFPSYDAKSQQGARTIIDSASSFLLLPPKMADAISEEIKAAARSLDLFEQFPDGYFRTERASSTKVIRFSSLAQIRQFPSLEISFRGVDGAIKNLEIPAQQYFKEIDRENPLVRTFAVRESVGDVVLGQPFLESHYAVFDRKNARIGFGNIDVACAQ